MIKPVTQACALLAALLLAGAAAAPARAAEPGPACDRVCLKGMVDDYIQTLIAHDPSKLPVSSAVRFTENGAQSFLGEGFWRTAGPGDYRLYAIDPKAGQVAAQAVLSEAGQPVIFMVRLKVVGGEITEIETLLCRKAMAGGLFAPQNLKTTPKVFTETIPPAERASRKALIAAADAYFTAVQSEGTPNYRPAPFAHDANRFENGLQTTNVPLRGGPPLTIGEQLDKGMFKGVTITDRRYPVVDEETGMVLGVVMFRRPNAVMPAGSPSGPVRYAGMVSEMFKVSGGKIREVRAAMLPRPFGALTGW